MASTERSKPKASSTKGKAGGEPLPARKELEARDIAGMVGEPSGRESVAAMPGAADVYVQPPCRR